MSSEYRKLEIRNASRCRVDLRLLRRIITTLLEEVFATPAYDLGLYLVGAAEITRLNETFLRHAGPTDVITFDYRTIPASVAPARANRRAPAGGDASSRAIDKVARALVPAARRGPKSQAGTPALRSAGVLACELGGRPARRSDFVNGPDASSTFLHGEIFICPHVAYAQAQRFRSTWQSELLRYAIHGLLHLRGLDDSQPVARRRMKRAEDRCLRQLARRFDLARLARGFKK